MATVRSVGGHEADDIDLLVESSVPLFAKRSGEATAWPAVAKRVPILVAAVVGIDFVPQPVQHRRPALVRGRGRFSEQPVPPPGDGGGDDPADPDAHADPPPGATAAGGSRVRIVRVHCSVPSRMKSSPRRKTIRRTTSSPAGGGKESRTL